MKKMAKQRLAGLILIAISAALLLLAFMGESPEDKDVTAVLFTLPLGLYALTTKKYILYDDNAGTVGELEQETQVESEKKLHSTQNQNCCPRRSGQVREFKKGATLWHENAL